MASEPTQYVLDGQTSFVGGQDASKTPHQVADGAVYAAVNCTFKKGVLGPRRGFAHREITFPDQVLLIDGKVTSTFKVLFSEGKFQALIPYVIGVTPYLIIVISGIVYLVNQNSMVAQPLLLPNGDRLNEFAPRLNWSFGSRFIVIFDFPNVPVIIENATIRRSNLLQNEVPVSNLGAYNQNRLFIANAGNEFTAGDPTGSLAAPDAPITFLETQTIGSPYYGQIFQLPTNYINSPITCIGFLDFTDASTGIGALLIATKDRIFSVNAQNPRAVWEQGQFVSSFVSNAGIAGARAKVNVNSDFFFISSDGQLRTASMSRDEQHKWTKIPMSREVENWLKYSDISLAQYAALGYFQNKIFVTANPYRVLARTLFGDPIVDYAFGGFVEIELDNISNLTSSSPPVWGGLWTGIRPMDICNNFERCFVMSKDEGSTNSLWEIDTTSTYDTSNTDIRYVRSIIYTRDFSFNDPFIEKNLIYIDLPFQNIEGDFKAEVEFKPSSSPKFLPWGDVKINVPWRACDVNDPCLFNGFNPADISGFRLGAPEAEDCNLVTKVLYRYFREVQLKFTIEGLNWELPYLKMKAVTQPRSDTDTECNPYATVSVCKACNDDWVIPPFDKCIVKET